MPAPKDPQKYLQWRANIATGHIGLIPWNKGKKLPEFSGQNNPMFGKTSPMKGKHHTEETKQKISNSKKGKSVNKGQASPMYGKTPWNKGRKGLQIPWNKGRQWPDEIKQKLSEARKGKKLSIETRLKLKGRIPWNKNIAHTEEAKEKIRQRRAVQIMPVKDTKPERIFQKALIYNSLNFKPHKLIRDGSFYHQVDIFIEPNICIEIDGDYWHSRPEIIERDNLVNEKLRKLGYRVYRFWENEIKKDVQNCIMKIFPKIIA